MPLYEFQCPEGHVTEILLSVQHQNVRVCDCGKYAKQIPSLPSFRIAGRVQVNDGADDPWEGTPLAGMGEPNTVTYKSDKIFVDQGTKTRIGARDRPENWAQRVAEATPP